jgi:arsenate reductase
LKSFENLGFNPLLSNISRPCRTDRTSKDSTSARESARGDGLRAKEALATDLGLLRPDVTDDEILDAMVDHPILIDRPLVETDKGVRLCRPQDAVREIL